MISWRERGPGRGQPENAPWPDSTPPFPHRPAAPASLSRAGDWPPACLWPAQVQLPSAPAFSPGPPPPGLGLPRGCSAGLRGGAGLLAGRGRGSILPDCVSGDIRWEAAPPRTQAHYPFLDEAVGVLVGSGVTRINLNGSPFSRSEGAPPARGRSTKQQSQQRLAEDSGCGGGADRAVQLSPRPGRSPPRSTLLGLLPGLSRAPRPHQERKEPDVYQENFEPTSYLEYYRMNQDPIGDEVLHFLLKHYNATFKSGQSSSGSGKGWPDH
uniref:Uncharacterized protein n=1 Tax=Capra hircus TaxID=9925 RepID=A0A8C2P159_CAPHI